MKITLSIVVVLLLSLFAFSACDKDNKPDDLTVLEAFNNYWGYQDELNGILDDRETTMDAIVDAINGMGSKDGELDAIKDLIDDYTAQSEAAAAVFDKLLLAENAFVPYGEDKGLLDFGKTCAKTVYTVAKNNIVNTCKKVNTIYSVATGEQSVSEALYNPDSGIPFISTIAGELQGYVNKQDNSIRSAILANDNHDGNFPLDQIPGNTPQQKINIYNSWPDSHPLKKGIRASTVEWDETSRTEWAKLTARFGEIAVKSVADAVGLEFANDVLEQHLEPGQAPTEQGTLNVALNEESGAHAPITAPKVIIISKANRPDDDPSITILTNAPQHLEQPLPTGNYNVIVMAEGYIRSVYQNLQILQGQANTVMTELAKLAENPIIIEDLSIENNSITVGDPATASVSCVSTLGQELSFAWTVTGGTYSNLDQNGTSLTFTPTEEKEYTITVTVTDEDGNTKVRSLAVTSMASKLVIDDWTLSGESFTDGKINPGESGTVTLMVSNTGDAPITGIQSVSGSDGITTNLTPSTVTIAAGQTLAVAVPYSVITNLSDEEGIIQYLMQTQNANNVAAEITDQIEFPFEFTVHVTPIEDTVTERVVSISGTVSNPSLTTAVLFLDDDMAHGYDLNLDEGYFYQDVVLPGSDDEEEHSVRVVAVSGTMAAEDVMEFDVDIPLMALRATLTWNTIGTDVDFWITDPNGEKCYYANDITASGLTLDVDDTDGYGPENITTEDVLVGDYLVQVHYYSDHDSEEAITSDCMVTINRDEDPDQTSDFYGTLNDSGDIWTVATLTYEAAKGWKIKSVNKHSKVESSTLPAK